jgi:coiled-coil-helix-coiled-coil-helix domain-containing protein 2
MLSNIVSTAAGVGIGHAIGHGLTGMFSGGSSAPQEEQQAPVANNNAMGACDADAKSFTKCMDDFKGDLTVCNWYLEQLKVTCFHSSTDCRLVKLLLEFR